MNEVINNIIYFFIASGLLTWLIKSIFNQYFSKDLEKFKAKLEIEAFNYRVKYEKMHTERAEAIKQIYKKIIKTHRSFHTFMAPLQMYTDLSGKEKGENAAKNANDFTNYFEENKIFLEKDLADKIDKLSKTFRSAWNKFQTSRMSKKENDSYIKYWDKAWKIIDEEAPKITKEIEKDFRNIIGINEKQK